MAREVAPPWGPTSGLLAGHQAPCRLPPVGGQSAPRGLSPRFADGAAQFGEAQAFPRGHSAGPVGPMPQLTLGHRPARSVGWPFPAWQADQPDRRVPEPSAHRAVSESASSEERQGEDLRDHRGSAETVSTKNPDRGGLQHMHISDFPSSPNSQEAWREV